MAGRRACSGETPWAGPGLYWSIGILALLVRGAVLWLNLGHPTPFVTLPDSGSYIRCAEGLVRDLSMVGEDGQPYWDRTPGYPAMLALAFVTGLAGPDRLAGVLLVQIVLSSAVAVMGVWLATTIGTWRHGLVVGVLLALEPSLVTHSNLILTESVYTFVITGVVLVAWKWLARPGHGSLIGLALLTAALPLIRPVAYHLPWVLAPIVLWRAPAGSRVRATAAFLILALSPSVAWSMRNYVHVGAFALDQIGPLSGAMFARRIELRAGLPETPEAPDSPWRRDFADGRTLPPGEAIARQKSYFADVMRTHPVETLKELLYSGTVMIGVPDSHLHTMISGDRIQFEEGTVRGRLQWLRTLGAILPLVLMGMLVSIGGVVLIPLFLWRVHQSGPAARGRAALMVIFVAYHLALAAFVRYQGERYRVPVIPLLTIIVVCATAGTRRTVESGQVEGQATIDVPRHAGPAAVP
jgi:hypothetical protein